MMDSVEFNIEFIQEVEKNAALYNPEHSGYSDRRTTEFLWAQIGDKFDATVDKCKAKWKSIRSAFLRTINNKSKTSSGARSQKEYYLASYLQFIIPFTKTRCQSTITSQDPGPELDDGSNLDDTASSVANSPSSIDAIDVKIEGGVQAQPSQHPYPAFPMSIAATTRPTVRRKTSEDDECAFGYVSSKKKRLGDEHLEPQHPCELFLLSVVPHVKTMTDRQQLMFQRGVLGLIDKIKYGQSSDASMTDLYHTGFSKRVQRTPQKIESIDDPYDV